MSDPPPNPRRLDRREFLSMAAGVAAGAAFWPTFDPETSSVTGQPAPDSTRQPETLLRATLPNGLIVIVDDRRSADTVAIQLTARAGARDDALQAGGTVLTSRMMLQGTTRRPSETELQRVAAQVGGALSRGTTVELSSITCVVPSREVAVAFDLVSDVALDSLFDPEALTRQRSLIYQEIAQRRAMPGSVAEDLFNAAAFAGHPASSPILGTPESIAALEVDDLLDRRARLWGAANMALTIVGRIRADEAMAVAERSFGALPAGQPNARSPAQVDLGDLPRTARGEAGQQQVEFRLGFPTAGLLVEDRYPLTVFNALMTGSAGRLFREVRSARGLAYVAGSAFSAYTDAGAWFATAGVDPENVDAALEVVRSVIETARQSAPDAGLVGQKIGQIAGRQILADETNSARAGRLASQQILGTEATDEFVRRIRAVTPQDVLRVAQTYLDPARAVLVVVSPPRGGEPAVP